MRPIHFLEWTNLSVVIVHDLHDEGCALSLIHRLKYSPLLAFSAVVSKEHVSVKSHPISRKGAYLTWWQTCY